MESHKISHIVTSLASFQKAMQEFRGKEPPSTTKSLHESGTSVLIKTWKDGPPASQLASIWKRPYTAVLSTPTAIKVPDITSWIHHTWVKPYSNSDKEQTIESSSKTWTTEPLEDLKLLFKKKVTFQEKSSKDK